MVEKFKWSDLNARIEFRHALDPQPQAEQCSCPGAGFGFTAAGGGCDIHIGETVAAEGNTGDLAGRETDTPFLDALR